MDFNQYKPQEVRGIIGFAVDNNPTAVAAELKRREFDISGINIRDYKDLLYMAYENGGDINWLFNIKFIKTANNWTTRAMGPVLNDNSYGSASKGIGWDDVGNALLVGGASLLATILGGSNSGTPAPAPVDHTDQILGIQKEMFYVMMFVAAIIVALIIYVVVKKK